MPSKRGGAGDRLGTWFCFKLVLLVGVITSVWQVMHLQMGPSQMVQSPKALAELHASDLAAAAGLFKSYAKAWSVIVPAESPLASEGATLTESASLAFDRTAVSFEQLSFSAESPLLSLAASVSGESGDDDDDSDPSLPGKDSSSEQRGECNDVHPNADSPDMFHVMFACDLSQIEGLQASVASVVANAASPDDLTIHVMVQKKWIQEFKANFGIEDKCWGTVTVTGVLVRLHAVDGSLIEKARAKVSSAIRKERGAIDTIENFARFYMHLIIDSSIVVYLDADIIVQADLAQLRRQLLQSGKTVGFVNRESPVLMDKFLREPKTCKIKYTRWKDVMKMPAYNVGVFALNLDRWKKLRIWERVEDLVAQHNECGGQLWVGGSQPPLLLAFLNRPKEEQQDYIVFDAGWNGGDLGWRKGMSADKLQKKYVLHWNGNLKPWFPNGLYRNLWTPYRQKFDALMKPYGSIKEQTTPWYVNNDCTNDRAFSCDMTCKAMSRTCDVDKLVQVNTEATIAQVAVSSGHFCESYAASEVDTSNGPWDGPWVQGGVCGYHSSQNWQAGCDTQPVCGYSRFCPCKATKESEMRKKSDEKKKKKDGKGRRRATTPPPTADQLAQMKKCPNVRLLDSWSENKVDGNPDCVLGKSFGCGLSAGSMWTSGSCYGVFSVSDKPTQCGDSKQQQQQLKRTCQTGAMVKPSHSCNLRLLTSYFTTRKDWQREKYAGVSFSKFQKLYQTVHELGLNVSVIYDDLPADILQYGHDRWQWEKINLADYDAKYGVNDVRYFFFDRLLQQHTEWEYVFVIDAFDVRVHMNPCPGLRPDKLYVGGERDKLKGHPWMKARYFKMGGKYNEWYKQKVTDALFILNCGLTGGHRKIMLDLFRRMIKIMSDPELVCRKANQDINVNMAALNYIVYNTYHDKFITGSPMHSLYKRLEVRRRDVWFVHK